MLQQHKGLSKAGIVFMIILASLLCITSTKYSLVAHATEAGTTQEGSTEQPSSETPTPQPGETPTPEDNIAALTAIITKAEAVERGDFTDESFTLLTEVLIRAREVQDKIAEGTATEEEIASALSALTEAYNNLALDTIELDKAIEEAEALDEKLYTKKSYKAVKTALTEAKRIKTAVTTENKPKQTDIDTATTSLKDAIRGLFLTPQPYQIIGNTYYYNITQFRADLSDVSSPWNEEFQEALDKAGADHFTVIVVPDGHYRIADCLYIQSNTTMQLGANAVMHRTQDAVNQFNLLKTSDAEHTTSGYGGYSLAHDIVINGGVWDGGNIASATESHNLLYFGHSTNITVSNATIMNCKGSHLLEFAGCQNVTVSGCTFTGFIYGSDNFTSEAVQLDICYKSGSTNWTPGYKLDKTTCQNVVIENNTIIDYPRGIGTHHSLSGVYYDNITIRNNNIYYTVNCTRGRCTGIFLTKGRNVNVYGNTIRNYDYGMWFKSSKSLNIRKNKLYYNNSANIKYENCDVSNKVIKFTVTKDKIKSRTLKFTCPTMKKGNVKVKSRTYKFTKKKDEHTVKLKCKIKKNMKMTFYGKDGKNNQFYRIYYVPKKTTN